MGSRTYFLILMREKKIIFACASYSILNHCNTIVMKKSGNFVVTSTLKRFKWYDKKTTIFITLTSCSELRSDCSADSM